MDKKSLTTWIWLLGIAVVMLVATLIVKEIRDYRNKPPKLTQDNVGKTWVDKNGVANIVVETEVVTVMGEGVNTNTIIQLAAPKRSVERRPLEPEATKRLHDGPVIVSSVFEASGKGECASGGKALSGSYVYKTTVMARSEIIEKHEDQATGRIFVKEKRKFLQARDNIDVSDIDVAIALDTLPVDQVKEWVTGTCHIVSSVCSALAPMIPPAAPWLALGAAGTEAFNLSVNATFKAIYAIDKISARRLLGSFGVKIPDNIEQWLNEKVGRYIIDMIEKWRKGGGVQSIEGKSYIITYEQDKNGAPLNVDYICEDGRPITDTEWEILHSANAFLDSNVVPDTRCRVGDTWEVWADEVQDLFGAASSGRAEGRIRVERVADQPNGTWTLKLEPAVVEFRSDDGTTTGKMRVKDGNGLVDAGNASVESLHATASGNLRSLNKKRHFLFFDFVKRIEGDSNLRFSLTVEPAK